MPPPVSARRRDVAKLDVSFSACGSSLLAAVVVTMCSLERIARALPFSPLSLSYIRLKSVTMASEFILLVRIWSDPGVKVDQWQWLWHEEHCHHKAFS